MMQLTYLIALIMSLLGLFVLDYRFKLAYWADAKATVLTVTIATGIFLVWDMLGIGLGIFLHGDSKYALSYTLVSEFPVEELFFLVLLVYVTLLVWRGSERQWPRT